MIIDALRWLPPRLPGKARLARALLGSKLDRTDYWLTDRFGNRLQVPSLRESIAFHLLIDGEYEGLSGAWGRPAESENGSSVNFDPR